ncbi:MAG TPA: glycosyltransferase family 1 protein [Dehalococcoidia bacterium]|nr:glycosyltransferase family 1 protein [Dehalococcoidia bacterium]
MRIAIDATSVPPKPAGAGVYALELARALARRPPSGDGYAIFIRGDWLDEELRGRRDWRIERVRTSRTGRVPWEQARLPGRLHALAADVLHSTHHTLPLRPMRTKRVVTVHDVTFFRIPGRYTAARRLYMQAMTRASARVADAIIVPSLAVRDDVVRTLGVDAAKVSVIYEAAAGRFVRASEDAVAAMRQRYMLEAPYVLSVGSLEPGKNRGRLFRAFRALLDEGIAYDLVVAGQPAWKYAEEGALVRELRLLPRVKYLGYVPDDDLPALYSGATAFAFPSLYEGFGIPVLEAMACGVPVLTSAVSATAEVAGDAALLCDPESVESIRDGLRRLLTDASLRADYAARGQKRASEFSWARAAEETRAVYERVVKS